MVPLPKCMVHLRRHGALTFVDYKDLSPFLSSLEGHVFQPHLVFAGSNAKSSDAILLCPGAFIESMKYLKEILTEGSEGRVSYLFSGLSREEFPAFLAKIDALGVHRVYLAFSEDEEVKKNISTLKLMKKKYPEFRFSSDRDLEVAIGLAMGTPLTYPRRAVIEIFNDCNLACDFCWTHSPYRDVEFPKGWFDKKLTKEVIAKYVDELAEFEVENVELCAVGDPLFHPEVWEIIDYIKSKGLRLRISTNGTLITAKRAERFIEIGVEQLFMNISAGDRDCYHRIHNVSPTIYDNLERNLKYLSDLREKSGRSNPYMQIINVMTMENVDNLDKMLEFSASIRANYVDFRKVWVSDKFLEAVNFHRKKLPKILDQRSRLMKKMSDLGLDGNLGTFFDDIEEDLKARLEGAPDRVEHRKKPKAVKKQHGQGYDEFHMDPWEHKRATVDSDAGEVVPCSISQHFTLLDVNSDVRYCCMGDKVHSPYKKSIKEQWTSPRYKSFRKFWKDKYAKGENVCQGCPHVGENRRYQGVLERLDLVETVKKAKIE